MTRDAGDDAMTSEALATFTQGLLEQMQGRFQTMSDAIITKIDEMQEKIEALERSVGEIASETRGGERGGDRERDAGGEVDERRDRIRLYLYRSARRDDEGART